MKILWRMVFPAALALAGCSHSEQKPDQAPVQQAPAQQPAPQPAPQQPAPQPQAQQQQPQQQQMACPAFGSNSMPKGAHISDSQAGATAAQWAPKFQVPGACPVNAQFKNNQWEVILHGPTANNAQPTKLRVVVGNDGNVHSHAVLPPGSPDYNAVP